MKTIIISLDLLLTAISAHIIEVEPFGSCRTMCVTQISTPTKLKQIKYFIENRKINDLALWFKDEYNITHSKITISYGPEIENYLKELKNRKEN